MFCKNKHHTFWAVYKEQVELSTKDHTYSKFEAIFNHLNHIRKSVKDKLSITEEPDKLVCEVRMESKGQRNPVNPLIPVYCPGLYIIAEGPPAMIETRRYCSKRTSSASSLDNMLGNYEFYEFYHELD